MYSRDNIKTAIDEGHLKIIPYEEKNLTGIGYNMSTINFTFSINQGLLLKIYVDTTEKGYMHYVKIPAHDTVLLFSKEFLETDDSLAGTFHSKVSRVCQGLGHISTTLDPMWKGQLIIAVNNPTNKKIRFNLDESSGNIFTLLMYELDQKVTGKNIHDNNQGRCDLLLSHFTNGFSSWFHQKKHLELENFIVKEFANSLNGYDDFMSEKQKDKYTVKVKKLLKLEEQLQRDMLLIKEGRYGIGERGNYEILRDESQKELIRGCSIFPLKKSLSEEIMNKQYSQVLLYNDSPDIINIIKQYLMVIEYELETINHNRRIAWQNEKISKYAMENSKALKRRKIKQALLLIILLIVFVCISYLIGKVIYGALGRAGVPQKNILEDMAQILFGGVVTLIVGLLVDFVIKLWDKK